MPRLIRAALVKSSKCKRVGVACEETVAGIDSRTIVKIGNDHDIRSIVSYPSFDPALPLTCVIGRAQICVPITPSKLQTTKLVYQKNVDDTRHRIGAINGRGAILQDVDMIDHREWNQVDVHATSSAGAASESTSTPDYGSPFSVDQHQRFFGQQTAQVGYDAAIPAIGDVLIDARSHLLGQLGHQVGGIADA